MSAPIAAPTAVPAAPPPAGPPAAAPAPACLNCATLLRGPYCHACGQSARPRIVPFRRFVADGVAEHFGLHGPALRTLRDLVVAPGALTTAYVRGHYVRYVSPLRVYLVFSALYFVVLAATGTSGFINFEGDTSAETARFIDLLPKLFILVPPALALVLKGLYRRRPYLAHLVFACHFQAFFFLVSVFSDTVRALSGPPAQIVAAAAVDVLSAVAIVGFLYLSLRRVYGGGGLKNAGMTVLVLFGYLAVCVVIVVALLGVLWMV